MARIPRTALTALLAATLSACAFGHKEEEPAAPDAGSGGWNPGGGGGGGEYSCEEQISLEVEIVAYAPDLMLVLDRSSSMGEPIEPAGFVRKWDVVIDALDQVATSLADRIYFGVMLVPSTGETCAPGVVDIAPSPNSSKNMDEYLAAVFPGGGTPLADSLQNARDYYKSAPVNPNGRYVLVATDGLPNCESSQGEALDRALAAIRGLRDDGVKTYVIGYTATSDADVLDQFAAAGGTGSHVSAESAAELVDALEQVTKEVAVVSCEYQLANGPDREGYLDVSVGGVPIPHDPNHENGWDYDFDTRTLTFYGEACDALRTAGEGTIEAEYCGIVN